MNLDIVTIEDCLHLYENKHVSVLLNDGKVVGFEEMEENR